MRQLCEVASRMMFFKEAPRQTVRMAFFIMAGPDQIGKVPAAGSAAMLPLR